MAKARAAPAFRLQLLSLGLEIGIPLYERGQFRIPLGIYPRGGAFSFGGANDCLFQADRSAPLRRRLREQGDVSNAYDHRQHTRIGSNFKSFSESVAGLVIPRD
jgi:hypothetical protein